MDMRCIPDASPVTLVTVPSPQSTAYAPVDLPTGMVIDSFGEAVRQVVANGLSPVLNASGTASDASTNPLDASASTEEAKTHAGIPDGDSIRDVIRN